MVAARFVCVSNIDEWSRRASRLLKVVQFKYLHYKGEPGQMMTARRKTNFKKTKRSSTEIEKKGPTSWANRNLDRSTSLLETRVLRDSELSPVDLPALEQFIVFQYIYRLNGPYIYTRVKSFRPNQLRLFQCQKTQKKTTRKTGEIEWIGDLWIAHDKNERWNATFIFNVYPIFWRVGSIRNLATIHCRPPYIHTHTDERKDCL